MPLGVALVVAVLVVLTQYPRRVLLSDVRQSKRILVHWDVRDGNGTSRGIAFELDESARAEFTQTLTDNLGLDYFRTQATVTPTIGIYLTDDDGEPVAYYAVRCARGGGRCHPMESLRALAAQGRPLSEFDVDEVFNDEQLRSKWPHILPWPECRFDYVLPVTPSDENPLRDEWMREPAPDPHLRHVLKGHSKVVLCVAFSPEGESLATGSLDTTIKIWDAVTGKNVTALAGHKGAVWSIAYSPDGGSLASAGGDDLTIKLWDVRTETNTATLHGHKGIVACVAFSPNGKTLASGSWDKTVKLWDVATGNNIATLDAHSEYVDALAFHPGGEILASASADDTVRLWDVASGRNIRTLRGHARYVSSVAFRPDGEILASGSADSTVKLWNATTGENTITLKCPAPDADGPVSVAFSPNGKILASGGYGRKIKLWDAKSGKGIAILSGHTRDACCMAFHADSKTLAFGGDYDDTTVKLWDLAAIEDATK